MKKLKNSKQISLCLTEEGLTILDYLKLRANVSRATIIDRLLADEAERNNIALSPIEMPSEEDEYKPTGLLKKRINMFKTFTLVNGKLRPQK